MKKALLVGLLLVCARTEAEGPAVYALVGGRVVPVSGPALEKGTVFIDGVAQPLETRHARLYRQFKDRP